MLLLRIAMWASGFVETEASPFRACRPAGLVYGGLAGVAAGQSLLGTQTHWEAWDAGAVYAKPASPRGHNVSHSHKPAHKPAHHNRAPECPRRRRRRRARAAAVDQPVLRLHYQSPQGLRVGAARWAQHVDVSKVFGGAVQPGSVEAGVEVDDQDYVTMRGRDQRGDQAVDERQAAAGEGGSGGLRDGVARGDEPVEAGDVGWLDGKFGGGCADGSWVGGGAKVVEKLRSRLLAKVSLQTR